MTAINEAPCWGQGICQIPQCGKPAENYRMCADHYGRWSRKGDPYAPKRTHIGYALEAFIEAAVVSETSECIIWPYSKTRAGYGMLYTDGEKQMAARVVAERFYGPPPSSEHEVAHKPIECHNPACVNPRHIRWATGQENSDDKVLDLTRRRGEQSGTSKLTEAAVLAIRESKETGAVLARRHGVSQSLVSMIKHRRVWAHV